MKTATIFNPRRTFTVRCSRLALIASCCFAGLLGLAVNARAQNLNQLSHPTVQQPDDKTPRVPLPPAVPGSKPTASAAAPAQHPALDMPPTDALFDAINRGDIASAKDAIGRGADLNAQNVLGLTPLDLSVDLGRNDISFLLLSLRSADGPTTAGLAAAPTPTTHSAKVLPPASPRAAIKAPSAPKAPKLYAGDGGAAVPTAGFLGFGGGKTP